MDGVAAPTFGQWLFREIRSAAAAEEGRAGVVIGVDAVTRDFVAVEAVVVKLSRLMEPSGFSIKASTLALEIPPAWSFMLTDMSIGKPRR